MRMRISLPLCVACALLLVACSKTEVTTNRANSTPGLASATPVPPAAVVTTTGEKIGVPECDKFIADYDACVSGKVPEAARAQYKTMIEQWRASWKKLGDNPATKGSLAQACTQSAAQAKASMKAYNCTF